MSGGFSLNFRISAEFRQISLSQLSSVCSESGWKWVSLAVRIEMATVKTPNSILFKCKIMQSYNSMALNIWTVQVQILFLPIEYLMQTPGIEAQPVSDKITWVLQKMCVVVSVKPKKLMPMVCYTKHPRPSETANSFGPSVFFLMSTPKIHVNPWTAEVGSSNCTCDQWSLLAGTTFFFNQNPWIWGWHYLLA